MYLFLCKGELFEFQKGMNGEKKWSNSYCTYITKLQINNNIKSKYKKYKEQRKENNNNKKKTDL